MDWQKIRHHAIQFDRLVKKECTVTDVDEEVSHALAMMIYADAMWIADAPKEQRKEMLERIPELTRQDTKDMATMIIREAMQKKAAEPELDFSQDIPF